MKCVYKFYKISVKFENTKIINLILKISRSGVFDIRCVLGILFLFILFYEFKTVEKSSLNFHVYWDTLHQVALLSDQLDSQTDKITDLERVLDNKKEMLRTTEEVLQREIINRYTLGTS